MGRRDAGEIGEFFVCLWSGETLSGNGTLMMSVTGMDEYTEI